MVIALQPSTTTTSTTTISFHPIFLRLPLSPCSDGILQSQGISKQIALLPIRRSIKIHQWNLQDQTPRHFHWTSPTYSISPTVRRRRWLKGWKAVRPRSMRVRSISRRWRRWNLRTTRNLTAFMEMAITVNRSWRIRWYSATIINCTTRRIPSISTIMSRHRICRTMTIFLRSTPTNTTRWTARDKCSPYSTLTFQLVNFMPALATWTINSIHQT